MREHKHEKITTLQIFEVKPASVNSLRVGARVCAYWSQKYNHLYPGTVSDMDIDPKLDSNYVNVELDDGDNRDIHVNSIRFLPPRYPQVGKSLLYTLLLPRSKQSRPQRTRLERSERALHPIYICKKL